MIVGVCLLSIVGLEMVFDCACEAFEAFGHIRGMMGARDTAMRILIILVAPKERFAIAELNCGVGIELEPSTKEASFSVLGEFTKCCAFGDEVTIGRIRVKIAFELFGEGADLIVREFIRLFAGKTFEVVFGEEGVTGAFEVCDEVNGTLVMVARGCGGRRGGELRGWFTRRRRGGGGVFPTDARGVGSGRGWVGAKGRKNRGMGRGDRGRSGVVKPGVPWGRGRGMELIRDGAAYGVEL